MKVVLPDSSELELPDGATGRDAAAAIGPKLAEQAVLVRMNGRVQDLRLPLADGERIQILTTRDKDVERIEEEMFRELKEGRAWERWEVDRDEAKRYFADQGEDYKVELVETADDPISMYRQGDFTDLCRGPHLQDSKPIKALKLTNLAGAYWRGDEHNKQLTRIYGTAFYDKADLDAYLQRLEQARERDHRRLGPQLDLFHLSEHAPGSPFWHPKGMVIWNALEDLRRRENAKRARRGRR